MNLVSKWKKEILLFLGISVLYFLLRFIFIDKLPIFTDEAIYMRWAQIALNDSSWRFISLTDGKQPLYVWFAMVFMKLIHDPLIAGRTVSVLSGFMTMLGIFLLTFELFKNKTTAFFTSFLYVFYPMAEVYDRMALMDGMVGTFAVWGLYFSVLLVRRIRLDVAYTLALLIGGGSLTKTDGFFTMYMLPFTLLLFDFGKNLKRQRFIRWLIFALFASGLGYLFYNILRLSPLFSMINAKNAGFVYPFSDWLHHPFTFFYGNLYGLMSWLTQYLKLPYILLILVSVVFIRNMTREKLLLLAYCFLPFIALALFGRIIFPRFIYFMSLFLIPLAADGLNIVIQKVFVLLKAKKDMYFAITVAVVLVFILYPAFVSYQFASDPLHSQIADSDYNQYINSWSAGWGVKESVVYFKQQASNQKIYIATEGTFGLMPESMELYLIKNPNVTIKGFWPVDNFPEEVQNQASKMPTYFIFYQPQHFTIPQSFPLKLVFEVKQGNTSHYYRVYRVLPKT